MGRITSRIVRKAEWRGESMMTAHDTETAMSLLKNTYASSTAAFQSF